MSIVQFSKCSITFRPNNRTGQEKNFSDRSVIELREVDFLHYIIRAVDVANENKVRHEDENCE